VETASELGIEPLVKRITQEMAASQNVIIGAWRLAPAWWRV